MYKQEIEFQLLSYSCVKAILLSNKSIEMIM